MTSIQIFAQGAAAWGRTAGIVTAGAVGIPVAVQCSRAWDGLRKILKIRCGEVRYQLEVTEGTPITVPWDCLLEGRRLEMALDGWDSAGTLRIPTNWVCCAVVQPSGAQGTEPPAPPQLLTQQLLQWAEQTQEKLDNLPDAGQTEAELAALRQDIADKTGLLAQNTEAISRTVNGYVEGFLARYIKIVFGDVYSGESPETSAAVAEVRLLDADGVALAIKSVAADSVLSDSYPAANALDGDPGSFWISARVSGAEHYLLLELETPANARSLGVIARPDKSYHRIDSFRVLASADGESWQEIGRFEALKNLWALGKWKTFSLTPTQRSYYALRDEVQLVKKTAMEAGTVPVAEAGGWDYGALPVTAEAKTAAFEETENPMDIFPRYALLGQNFFPWKAGFNKSMPCNGITLEEAGRVMHITGTASAQATLAVTVDGSPYLEFPEGIAPGKAIILRTFLAGETVKNGIYVTLLFYDSANKQISFKNHFCGENGTDASTQVTVPSNAASFGIWWNVKSPGGENHSASVCAALYDAACELQAGSEAIPGNAQAVSFFPTPVSGFFYRPSVKDYVDRHSGDEATLTAALGYLTPEMFGAKGDYLSDDAAAINACLEAAAKKNLPVRAFKRYKTAAPVVIDGKNMDVDINTIRYVGTDTAVTLEGWWNRVRIGRIYSDGIGLTIQSKRDSTVYNQLTLNDVISKDAHGIVITNEGNPIFQNQIQFARILGTGKAGTHGITFGGERVSCAECTFTGGQISGFDYAVKLHSGNHKFQNIHVESNMQGGFWIIGGGCLITGDRHAESSRDGKYCFLKMTTDSSMHAVDVNGQYTSACRMPVNEIDLSEVALTENADSIDNGHYFTMNCPISPGIYYQSNQHKTCYLSDGAKLWGGNIILNPTFRVYRKITEAVFDNRANDQNLEPLPTTFEIGAANCQVYLHASYCFMGYSRFEVIQTEAYQADIYDWRGTKIFAGADHGAGKFLLEHVITAEDGKGRYDGTGTQWITTKERTEGTVEV